MRAGWWITPVVACACAAAPAPTQGPRDPPPRIEIPPASASEPPAPTEPEAAPVLAEVREPERVACRIAEKSWSFTGLRLRNGGPAFASVNNAPTVLVVPAGEPASPTAVFDDAQVQLRGVVAKSDVRLYARAALVLKGFLIPTPRTALLWSGGAAASLRLGVDAKAVVTWPELVEDDLSCDKIGLNVAEYSAREQVTKRTKLMEKEVARADVELLDQPGGTPVARLRDGVRVELVQVQGKQTKILVEHQGYVVFGWVASADLRPPMLGVGYGTGFGRLGSRHVSYRGGRLCARDLTLLAEVGDERAKVGVLKRGAPFDVVSDESARPEEAIGPPPRGKRLEVRYLRVAIPRTRWLTLVEKARLLVPEDEYRECHPPPPPPPAPPPP